MAEQTSTSKVVVITGGNAGIGFEMAKELAKNQDWQIVIACRSVERGNTAVASSGAKNILVRELDLCSFASVKKFVASFQSEFQQLNILINNAGIMCTPFKVTEDGFEEQYQANHLGHFLLTNLLLPILEKSLPARIVNLSSRAHLRWGEKPIDYAALAKPDGDEYDPWQSYGRSKLSNVLFTLALHKRLEANPTTKGKIFVNCCHPGLVDTGLLTGAGLEHLRQDAIPVSEGIKTPLFLATGNANEVGSGGYWQSMKQSSERSTISRSESDADLCWENSIKFVGLKA